mmetsp:Transcript_108188/g.187886  ORF Transcript_108188/g.187886 Transcript_108188/m.187886 type:complete len:578 (+) Transcript_108188:62-1795(+)
MCTAIAAVLACLAWAGHARRVQMTTGRQPYEDAAEEAASEVAKNLAVLLLAEDPTAGWLPGPALNMARTAPAVHGARLRPARPAESTHERASARSEDVLMQQVVDKDSFLEDEEDFDEDDEGDFDFEDDEEDVTSDAGPLQHKKVVLDEQLQEKYVAADEEEDDKEWISDEEAYGFTDEDDEDEADQEAIHSMSDEEAYGFTDEDDEEEADQEDMDLVTWPEPDYAANVEGLKQQLRLRGLKIGGHKGELRMRLREHAELMGQGPLDAQSQEYESKKRMLEHSFASHLKQKEDKPEADDEEEGEAGSLDWLKEESPQYQRVVRTLLEDMPEIFRRQPRYNVFNRDVRFIFKDRVNGQSVHREGRGQAQNRLIWHMLENIRRKFIIRDEVAFKAESKDNLLLQIKMDIQWRKTPIIKHKRRARNPKKLVVAPFDVKAEIRFHINEEINEIDSWELVTWRVNGRDFVDFPDVDLYDTTGKNMKIINAWAASLKQPLKTDKVDASIFIHPDGIPVPILAKRMNETTWTHEYPSVFQAHKKLGIPRMVIKQVCAAKRRHYNGYVFRMVNNKYTKARMRDGY